MNNSSGRHQDISSSQNEHTNDTAVPSTSGVMLMNGSSASSELTPREPLVNESESSLATPSPFAFVTKRAHVSPKRLSFKYKKFSSGTPRVVLNRLDPENHNVKRESVSMRNVKLEKMSPVKRQRRKATQNINYKEPTLSVKLRRMQ